MLRSVRTSYHSGNC